MSQMMTIQIPEWAQDGHLRVLWNNTETVAYKLNGKDSPIMIKPESGRCNMCGECCLDIGVGNSMADDEGKCIYLVFEMGKYRCNAGGKKLVSCLGDPSKETYLDCSIVYEEQGV